MSFFSAASKISFKRRSICAFSWFGAAAEVRDEQGVTVAEDRTVEAGQAYWYRLLGTTAQGAQSVFGPVEATASAPAEFALSATWPSPTRGGFTLRMALPRQASIRLAIVDAQGREVAILASGDYHAGRYQVEWDGRSDGGPVRSGLYFVELMTPGKRFVSRVAIIR